MNSDRSLRLQVLLASLALAGTGSAWTAGGPGGQAAAQPSGSEILARTAHAYAHCASYRDTGVVTIVFVEATGTRVQERPFRTAFVRPDRFRFEFQETDYLGATSRYIVWRFARRVKTWWDVKPGIEEKGSLDLALAGATGVSGGSAHAIPALLLPAEVAGRRITEMTNVSRVADSEVGGTACFCIEGAYAGHPMTVCVEPSTFLIRRIDSERTFPRFRTRETTTYEPVLDEPVPEGMLEFAPPVAP